jgi:hypothetical protein
MWRTLLVLMLARGALALDTPSLNWTPRSDWINVKTDVSPLAVGNGIADDTAALQAGLSSAVVGKTVYLPAGTYRITGTLAMTNSAGASVIGNGKDTKIVWDGTNGGIMFVSNGNDYTKYNGLSWDGAGKASVGFDHAAKATFETEIQHLNESYRNFTNSGIRIGNNQVLASAEILYRNCLFSNCTNGISILNFNDYDNTIDHCQFENCAIGVYCIHGNFYARDSHFQNSSQYDFYFIPEHGCSIRRCTSTGAKYFADSSGTVSATTFQDCRVANWTATESAIHLSAGPVLVFDCGFTGGPLNSPPIHSGYGSQIVLISSNTPALSSDLINGVPLGQIYSITNGIRTGVITNANQTFLQTNVTIPGYIFDAKQDYGAVGNGIADDTTAIQNTINAAQAYGHGSMAYIPTGSYYISQTLLVAGANYYVGGSGRKTCLNWHGSAGQPFMVVSNATTVTLCDMGVGTHDCTVGNNGDDIRITSSGAACTVGIDGVYVYGKYDNAPNSHGLRLVSLPTNSVVDVAAMEGNIQITNCADASLIFRVSYEGTLTMRGPTSTNSPAGFLTRLTTIATPALQVMDNQSVVMSDFYTEQLPQHMATFSGNTNGPFGTVTIQGPKMDETTTNSTFTITGYAGRIYYGQVQFYNTPAVTLFASTATPNLQLLLSGCFWYNNAPAFDLNVVTPTLLGNGGDPSAPADSGVTLAAMNGIGNALDDLRRLGAMEVGQLTPPPTVITVGKHHGKRTFIGR